MQGPAVIGNTIQKNGASGIYGTSFSGSPALISDNIVESNQREGIYLSQSSVTLTIQGNDIENNGGGASHGGTGVSIRGSSSGSPFSANLYDNTINNNGGEGINVSGGTVTLALQNNDVEGNFLDGIKILSESGATIGGTSEGAGNVISGNGVYGILLAGTSGASSTGDLIEGNKIGVLASGAASGNISDGLDIQYTTGLAIVGNAIENNYGGIQLYDSIRTTIGGTAEGAANLISKNLLNGGIGMGRVDGLSVIDNTIDSNGSAGVSGSTFSGSAALFSGNVIESNAGAGIYLYGSSVTLTIHGNTIESNERRGRVDRRYQRGACVRSRLDRQHDQRE